jgi:hypothetical protein
MKYVTYIALMVGAAYTKSIVIDINEDELQRAMQIEQQAQDKLMRDPAFRDAVGKVSGDTA